MPLEKPRRNEEPESPSFRHSRRTFLKGVGLAAGAAIALPTIAESQENASPEGLRELGSGPRSIKLKINGKQQSLTVEPRTTLLDALREGLDMTGSKEICDRGSCGGCTVLLDGETVCSCMALAVDCEGREIVTIEGLASDPKHKALVESFCEHDAAQCGYCIPGFVVRSAGLLAENPSPTHEEIQHGLAGNICRCGTHVKIMEAVAAAAKGGAK